MLLRLRDNYPGTWGWRGKDLHYELQQAVKRARPDVASFAADLETQDEMQCYYGE